MVKLSQTDYEKMVAHAESELSDEACGLIAGRIDGDDKIIEKVYLLTNIDHSNEHFSLDPKEQLAAVKDMRANGLKPLGNWHTHPNHRPDRPRKISVWHMTAVLSDFLSLMTEKIRYSIIPY